MPQIELPGGYRIRTFQPPRGFDPRAASPADLERYGFPPRPDDPRHLARYNQVLGQLAHKLTYIQPTFRVNPEKFHGARRRPEGVAAAAAGTETSTNWSGGVVYAPAGQSFRWVE